MARVQRGVKTAESELLKTLSSSNIGAIGNYIFGRTLGEGTYGKVKLAKHKLTGQQVAIKIVDKIHAPTVVREIETWRHMHHPNIARLYEVLCSETRIFMVMEYCTGGEAFDYVCAHGRLVDRSVSAKRVVRQIAEAVGYCHEKRFVHRDLKLENILLTDELTVKLIDFGFTRQVNTGNLLDTYCGSVAYAAPEMISGKQYSGPHADVWSLGVIVFTLLCGYLPFDDDNESTVRRKILNLDYDLPDFLSETTKDLIQRMLKIRGLDRIPIKDMLKHDWFSDVDSSDISDDTADAVKPAAFVPDEAQLLRSLTSLGFDTAAMQLSVKNNSVDQASALWYLLLDQQRPGSAASETLDLGISPMVDSPVSPAFLTEKDGANHLAEARRKALGDTSASGIDSISMSDSSSSGLGRRGLVMDALKSGRNKSNHSTGGGDFTSPKASRGRRRWENRGGNSSGSSDGSTAVRAGAPPSVRHGLSHNVIPGVPSQAWGKGWITEESESEDASFSRGGNSSEVEQQSPVRQTPISIDLESPMSILSPSPSESASEGSTGTSTLHKAPRWADVVMESIQDEEQE
ncbi:kinase-like domain-containing protein [Phlyctochytrium arcticum]|nr:kinase-like domain-containing protein [Phlyctochytrium arcticum]